MNFEVFIPHQYALVDNCHYLDVTLTWLECDSVVDPDWIHDLTCTTCCILPDNLLYVAV